MIRTLATALVCVALVLAADVVFRTSLLRQLRPVILSPTDQAVLSPPVEVRWDGPQRMQLRLAVVGEQPRDLGVHESPVEIAGDQFPRDGGYEVEVRATRFGDWISANRRFQVHPPPAVVPPPPPEDHDAHSQDVQILFRALQAARRARDKAHERTRVLGEENASLHEESERLSHQLETLYAEQEDGASHAAELEKYAAQLGEENRALGDENAALRQRLSSVVPCSVWGYYTFPQQVKNQLPRRYLLVSDARGQVFRSQAECEFVRRTDPSTASICFCVGNSWGG